MAENPHCSASVWLLGWSDLLVLGFCHFEIVFISQFTGWPDCAAKVKRQVSVTQERGQCRIRGHWEQTTCTPGSKGAGFTYSTRRERGSQAVPTAGASTLQPAWAVWSHAPQLSCTRIQTPSQWGLKYRKLGCAWASLTLALKQNKVAFSEPERDSRKSQ